MASPSVTEAQEKVAAAQEGSEEKDESEERNEARGADTPEEVLQRDIEKGNIGKGKTLRRWKDTEEKQRMVESGRRESKAQRHGQIYDEVRALRKETRHSVQDMRERFKEKGVIQNKDQFIVRLIAQERNEQEGKVAAIRSLQQWRLTDVELHNFINRCHRKGLGGKLDLATQWAFEQEEAGGDVNFKEGLAFYSSIGILQPRSSAHTQQQWREWREWEDALTSALKRRKSRGGEIAGEGAEPAGPDASSNEDSTVCNSPWSSERGGGGSFGGFSGSLRASSAHGEGDAAGGYGSARFRVSSGTAPEASKDGLRSGLPQRGRKVANRDSPGKKREWWSWRSYSPPSTASRQKSAESMRKKANAAFGQSTNGLASGAGAASAATAVAATAVTAVTAAAAADAGTGKPPPSPAGVDPPDGAGGGAGILGESVVRSSGGYLPPRHPLATLQLSPASTPPGHGGAPDAVDAGADGGSSSGGESAPSLGAAPKRAGLRARGAARTNAKGPAGGEILPQDVDPEDDPAPTEEDGPAPTEEGVIQGRPTGRSPRRRRKDGQDRAPLEGRSRSLSRVFSGFADWLMPGMDSGGEGRGRKRADSESELILEVYPHAAHSDPHAPRSPDIALGTKSAPVTPRGGRSSGRSRPSSVLREGGWFYNGDSDYSTEEEDANYDSEDEGFWMDASALDAPRKLGGGGGMSILSRLRRLFTGI